MLVASAGFWSLVMVRQSRHAPNYPSFPLGTYKVSLHTRRSQRLNKCILGMHQCCWEVTQAPHG